MVVSSPWKKNLPFMRIKARQMPRLRFACTVDKRKARGRQLIPSFVRQPAQRSKEWERNRNQLGIVAVAFATSSVNPDDPDDQ